MTKPRYGSQPERMKWGPAIGLAVLVIAVVVVVVMLLQFSSGPKTAAAPQRAVAATPR